MGVDVCGLQIDFWRSCAGSRLCMLSHPHIWRTTCADTTTLLVYSLGAQALPNKRATRATEEAEASHVRVGYVWECMCAVLFILCSVHMEMMQHNTTLQDAPTHYTRKSTHTHAHIGHTHTHTTHACTHTNTHTDTQRHNVHMH